MSKFSDSTFYLAPSGYRETILFPQKPLSSIGHLSVGRASSATRTNPAGQVEQVCYNLFQYSEDFSNAYWTKVLGTLTTNTTVAPDGNLTADTFTKTSGVNTVSQCGTNPPPYTNTGVHTLSVYIKPIVGNTVLLRLDNANNTANATFNFTTKTFSTSGANLISSSYQELPNGWFRLSITGNVTSTSWTAAPCLLFENPTNDSMAIWGAQLVQGNLPKDYLYTSDRLNFPRVDYSDGSASFLLEPQRTNLCLQSNTFNTTWAMFAGPAVNANSAISPDGTNNAWTLNSSGGGNDFLFQNITVNIGTTYTTTLYIKNINSNQSRIWTSDGAGLTVDINWNGSILTSIVGTSGTYSFTSVGNGWYRIVGVFTSTQSTYIFRIYSDALNTSKSVYIYGAQVEQGAYPTTYIPTTTSTATRLADTFTRNNIYTNNLISSSGGTWFVELNKNLAYLRDTYTNGIILTDSGNSNYLVLTFGTSGISTQSVFFRKAVSGVVTVEYVAQQSKNIKLAIRWNGSVASVFADGVKVVSSTAFTTTQLEILSGSGADTPKYITQMALWNTPLSDSQCIELTGVAYTTPAQAYGSLNLVSESPDCLYTSVNTINRI